MYKFLIRIKTTTLVKLPVFLWLLIISLWLHPSPVMAQSTPNPNWYTAGANFQRTSWVSEQVDENLNVEWYRPIEAFIDFKTQVIAVDGRLYLATSRGLYALRASDGTELWRYDTEMPVATPTVINGVVYLPGYDGRIYALNADTGVRLWYTERAGAAFETTPVVVNNKVYNGNRDGRFYAYDSTNGNRIWRYPDSPLPLTGSISQSAVYDQTSNTLYFAANDMHAYALDASDNPSGGNRLRWKSSNKLPGQDFRNFWPVIVGDWVVFVSNHPYRFIDKGGYQSAYNPLLYNYGTHDGPDNSSLLIDEQANWTPGSLVGKVILNMSDVNGTSYGRGVITGNTANTISVTLTGGRENDWDNPPPTPPPNSTDPPGDTYLISEWCTPETLAECGPSIGPKFLSGPNDGTRINWPWPAGSTIMNVQKTIDVLTQNPHLITHTFLNRQTGTSLAYPAPFILVANNGTGSMYPPIVSPNNLIYQAVNYEYSLMTSMPINLASWFVGTSYVRLTNWRAVTDEPEEYAGGGSRVYRWWYDIHTKNIVDLANDRDSQFPSDAPGYDVMLNKNDSWCYWYKGNDPSVSGKSGNYCNARRNPPVPHQDRLYYHNGNALFALGAQWGQRLLSAIPIHSPSQPVPSAVPSTTDLVGKLEAEIKKILDVYNPTNLNRFLLPGYRNDGWMLLRQHASYFSNPGDTLYSLSLAYNHISNIQLKNQLGDYLSDYYNTYFGTACDNPATSGVIELCAHTGWEEGASRDAMNKPPDWLNSLSAYDRRAKSSREGGSGWLWQYPLPNFYAMWKYVDIVKNREVQAVQDAYNKAARLIVNQFPDLTVNRTHFIEYPFEVQMYIAGYQGFIGLCDLFGASCNSSLRSQAVRKMNEFIDFRRLNFTKDSYWYDHQNFNRRRFNIAQNFMWLTPGAADLLGEDGLFRSKVQDALHEYNYVAPLWFIGGLQISYQENSANHLFDPPALFQAKAWILNESREELYKYLDTPMFERGDLFYIQNLVATIEAPTSGTEPSPTPTPSYTCPTADANRDGDVDGLDYSFWSTNYNDPVPIDHPYPPQLGDFTCNRFVDGADYAVWFTGYR